MQKNDYRRALIMLRSLMNGYSGHARLEVRTLTGSLNIRATIPSYAQSVRAAFVGRQGRNYYAYPLGELRRDMRGQAGLSVNFDPRDIGGRTLDAYSLLVLVSLIDGVCELALVGNLNGSCENNWEDVQSAVCALYAPQPRSVEPEAVQEPEPEPEPEAEIEAEPEAVSTGTNAPTIEFEFISEEETEPEAAAEPAPALITDTVPEAFRQEGWSYSRMQLPWGCGYDHAYIGIPACGGEVCCALPGNYALEPPVGLDDYHWIGESGGGWWVKCVSTTQYSGI